MRWRALAVLLLSAALIWVAPLVGALAAGHPVWQYLDFPPRTAPIVHAPFAWPAFVAFSLPAVAAATLVITALARARPGRSPQPRGRFPVWGWLGVAVVCGAWMLAWSEALLPPQWRRHMFSVIWLGYIVAMNGVVLRRGGRAPLLHRSRWFLLLFPVSAAAWWSFEYLNQFVANWYYTDAEPEGSAAHFLQATLPFSTVLPAVASTRAWLATFPRFEALALPAVPACMIPPRLRLRRCAAPRGGGIRALGRPCGAHRSLAWIALAGGVLGLAGLGIWPELLFSMLWLAPLCLLAGLQWLLLDQSLFAPLRKGDWSAVLQPALAALICGFFWELWNYGSLAKWHYSIPFVHRFELFEMPVLGYAGYLPFGVECALIMQLVAVLVGDRRESATAR